ncbi:feruloyl-CoA synthase [Altererythrobacter xiamenensis]|uniref:Feruloyl-CoA synthase n=1 Tax=Altererythrobacter xiamenensis TaxID=1316679 RepID=A0A1Y6EQA2_9SPHN|nr:AMP-binding protein [Altererythrobacter xiamenensis]SMQ64459.1 feruloyl-CoA synthase [Altererythrobacter xiamenensis]
MTDTKPPFSPLPQKGPATDVERREDGSILIRSRHDPADVPPNLAAIFRERSEAHPDRSFLLQREPGHGPWTGVTWAEARAAADSIAQWLIDHDFGADDPVMVISGNSLEHGLLMLGCYTAGVPIAPVSAAYSLMSQDHEKLLHCFRKIGAKAVFAKEGSMHSAALARLRDAAPDLIVITCDGEPGGAVDFSELCRPEPTDKVDERVVAIGPDTVGKYLFTSGSTGMPKCVPQTHGMMTTVIAGQEGLAEESRDKREPAVGLEWMPWSHISAGNIFFNGLLWAGGTMYLDEGKPIPGMFETTIKNLYEVSPTVFGSAPVAFSMLADAMEKDERLRASFFKRVISLGYGGATLSDDLYDRLQALAIAETGKRIPITTMYGATETQGITMVHWVVDRVGLIGLPMPGITLKLVPNGAKMEVRVKGSSVTPGYKDDPEKNAEAFDEEGFYCLGDAAGFLDEDDPDRGLVFDGRVTEDFKLSTGTWVSVGTLRPQIVAACSPLIHDCVVAGQDREHIGLLVWPSPVAAQKYVAENGPTGLANLAEDIASKLASFNASAGGTSRKVGSMMLLTEPPSLDAGEITDKGYINQGAVLAKRAEAVEALYSKESNPLFLEVP